MGLGGAAGCSPVRHRYVLELGGSLPHCIPDRDAAPRTGQVQMCCQLPSEFLSAASAVDGKQALLSSHRQETCLHVGRD